MKFETYMEGAARTMPQSMPWRDLLADAALGLCGEAGEIVELVEAGEAAGDEFDDELGDGWWYVAAAYHAMDRIPEPFETRRGAESIELFRAASLVAESAKKVRYHRDDLEEHLEAILRGLRRYAGVLSSLTDSSDAKVWKQNVDKLAARWPEGFAPEG
jgi:NTP pyrophosphatase (non-canonical NTP hydrolase)